MNKRAAVMAYTCLVGKLARQIAFLERQMRATRQTRRQRELYAEIKKLKTQYHEETDHEEP